METCYFLALAAATLDDGARGQGVEPAAHSASLIDGLSLLLQLELRCMEETELLFVWRTSRRWRRRKVRACTKFKSNRCPNCNLSFNLWCLCVVMLVHDLNIPLCCFNFRKTVVNRVFNFGWVGTPVTNKVTEEMIWKAFPRFFEIPNSFV